MKASSYGPQNSSKRGENTCTPDRGEGGGGLIVAVQTMLVDKQYTLSI